MLNFAVWYWNRFLMNVVMLYIILMHLSHFIFFFANDLLLAVYFIFKLWKWWLTNRKFNQFSYSSSKGVVRQQRQLVTSTMHLAQELLTNIQGSGDSRNFAKEMRALKMRSAMDGHQKLTTTKRENHQSWSSYNYMRSCRRLHHWPFYGHLAFEANWKGEKVW